MTAAAPATQPGVRRPVPAAPATRRLARELKVDINLVTPTGPGGRVTPEDVHRFVDEGGAPSPAKPGPVDHVPAKKVADDTAFAEFAAHLDRRLSSFENPDPPVVEGVAAETSALLWAHREELSLLDLAAYSELHGILRGGNNVNIKIDGEGE